jgi:hypothetical protein
MNNDLISRSALKAEAIEMEIFQSYGGDGSCMGVTVGTIDCAPAVDAELVRHGRYDAGGDCTVCGYPMPTDDRCDAIFPSEIKYCYNCGAKMDAEVHDDA